MARGSDLNIPPQHEPLVAHSLGTPDADWAFFLSFDLSFFNRFPRAFAIRTVEGPGARRAVREQSPTSMAAQAASLLMRVSSLRQLPLYMSLQRHTHQPCHHNPALSAQWLAKAATSTAPAWLRRRCSSSSASRRGSAVRAAPSGTGSGWDREWDGFVDLLYEKVLHLIR